jgi:hypothetical protein
MQLLKVSTAFTTIVGPILDSTGAEYTGAVIGDLTLTKNGTSAAMAAAATLTHISNGYYTLVGTTGNSDTLGRADVTCNKSTYQMPPVRFTVLAATAFDTLVTNGTLASTTSGRTLDVSAGGEAGIDWANIGSPTTTVAFTGTTVGTLTTYTGNTPQTGDSFARIGATGSGLTSLASAAAQTIRTGTAQAGAAGTITLDASASATDNLYKACWVLLTGGTGAGQVRYIDSYVGSTKVVSVATKTWTVTPNATTTFAILPAHDIQSVYDVTDNVLGNVEGSVLGDVSPGAGSITAAAMGAGAITAAALASDAVTEIQSGLATSAALATVQADTDNIQTRLPAALVSGRMDASVGAMAADTLTASALATDAVTEIATGILDLTAGIETGLTLRQAMRLLAAAEAGKLSGAATTTITIRNAVADSKNRITAVVDSDGNRSGITYDLT